MSAVRLKDYAFLFKKVKYDVSFAIILNRLVLLL